MKDPIGERMKEYYEKRARTFLPRRTYTMIRIDGKTFKTYTKGLKKPFDEKLVNDMDETAKYLCASIQGAKMAFVQSDEISILLTDFDKLTTDAWFNGNVLKITSISASLATAKFNSLRPGKLAIFDSRPFTIPSRSEVANYFLWRQQDTVRNSIATVAQSLYSHKELEFKNSNEMQEMTFKKGVNWNDVDPKLKRGRIIMKVYKVKGESVRSSWESVAAFDFNKDWLKLEELIPKHEDGFALSIQEVLDVLEVSDSIEAAKTFFRNHK